MIENSEKSNYESSLNYNSFIFILLSVSFGILLSVIVMPSIVPNLVSSLSGEDPKVFWYLSRGSALVSFVLLWISMVLGLLMTNKLSKSWPGSLTAFAIHEYVSLLGIGFSMFHAIILLGDKYMNFTLKQIMVPFSISGEMFFPIGIGQISLYVWLIIAISFYFRSKIGAKTWRIVHYASFILYLVAIYHSLSAGTDVFNPGIMYFYWLSTTAVIFLLFYRIINSVDKTIRMKLTKINLIQS